MAIIARPYSRYIRPARLDRVTVAAWLSALLLAGITTYGILLPNHPQTGEAATPQVTLSNPAELSAADRGLYGLIKNAQAHHDYSEADALIAQLSNRNLVGYVLAERYLDNAYKASDEELVKWLNAYADHPQASRIAAIASRRGLAVNLPKSEPVLQGAGYADHEGRSTMPDSWFHALSLWRSGEYAATVSTFRKLSEDEDLSDWQQAAANYWLYRALEKTGEHRAARKALRDAAQFATTFYGQLAATDLGIRLPNAEAPEVSEALRNDGHAIRAALLAQLGENDEAEDELRALYASTSADERGGIVTLASELNLANLQMRLAGTPGLSMAEQLYARFPAPTYMLGLSKLADPALVMAVARNESSFREMAKNPSSGAMGMMQMLPSTARALERRVGDSLLQTAELNDGAITARLADPALGARYGAAYLHMLNTLPAIQGNLVHLLVGYNAGPGTVVSWKATAATIRDPLLYIESMPYAETRNYTMQVLAQYWVYQRMLGEHPASLNAMARGEWPQLAKTN